MYYSLFNEINEERSYYQYTNSDDTKSYIKLQNKDKNKSYFIEYPTNWYNLTNNRFKKGDETNVVFNLGANSTKVSIIYNYVTGKTEGKITEYKSFDESVTFYKCNDSNYIIINNIDDDVDGGIVTGDNGTLFNYECGAVRDNISTWSILDLFIKIAKNNTDYQSKTISGSIYNLGTDYYFSIQDTNYNINLTALGVVNSSNINNVKTSNRVNSIGKTVFTDIMEFPDMTEYKTSLSGLKSFFKLNDSSSASLIEQCYVKTDIEEDVALNIYFSQNFDFSNFSTWKLSDYLIYYLYEKTLEGSYKNFGCKDSSHTTCEHKTKNFQYYVNLGYVPAYLKNLKITSPTGEINRLCLVIGPENSEISQSDIGKYCFVNYNLFYKLYLKTLTYVDVIIEDKQSLILTITGSSKDNSDAQKIDDFGIKFSNEIVSNEFTYDNYVYFKNNMSIFDAFEELEVTDIYSNKKEKQVNLRLSTGFDISSPQNWTILDYIVVYEYSRNVANNVFYGLSFQNLKEADFYIKLNQITGGKYILSLNGSYYNLTKWAENSDEEMVVVDTKLSESSKGSVVQVVGKTQLRNGYDFKVLQSQERFNLNSSRLEITRELAVDKDSFTYTSDVRIKSNKILSSSDTTPNNNCDRFGVKLTYYRSLNREMYFNFLFQTDRYPVYTISPIIKTVSWPQKLMNDMMVMYPDLNWANLIATDGWIDTLGEYHSGTISGQFIDSGNSANITAVGMVLSEFFLTCAKEVENGFADYTYESIFDESTLKALMLSMLGEEKYNAVAMEAKVFVDLFNTGFASILDSLAAERGIDIKNGEVTNLVTSVYKSYLATAILSSDIGEYMYTIATRVYSQYTIYESLARASNNYAGYFAYINGQPDETGTTVDYFTYSSFHDLVKYENQLVSIPNDDGTTTTEHLYLREGDVPMFTFNYRSVYRMLLKKGVIESKAYDKDRKVVNENLFEQEVVKSIKTYDNQTILDWLWKLIKAIGKTISKGFDELEKSIKESFNCNSLLELIILRASKASDVNGAIDKLVSIYGDIWREVFEDLIALFNQPENTFSDVLNGLWDEYNSFYIIDTDNLVSKAGIDSKDPIYCFMFDVYYIIK
ncbi:MAG: hypothetical protein IJZ77_04710, partial [Bacilli bacterium]|nr:hypothetical protein [Bacilli bacterium]